MIYEKITGKILTAFFNVYNVLGYGFLERVYINSLVIELTKLGLMVKGEDEIQVYYEGEQVGKYFADLIVEDLVIIEVKTAEGFRNEHLAQLKNYLRATDIEIGLLLNFGNKPEFKRLIFTNDLKAGHQSSQI